MRAILNDVTRCIGCEQCVAKCVEVHGLGDEPPRRWQAGDGLGENRWTSVLYLPDNHHVRKQCRHCLEPACVSACPVGAMHKTPEGPVIYDATICLGCRYCMMACPFGIPRYGWSSANPAVRKCTMCYERFQEGATLPACVEACPAHATEFGSREEMLAEAHRRIDAEPGRYIHRVWGDPDVGGTSVLYISHVSLDFLGLCRTLGSEPLGERTRLAMSSVPFVFVGMGALMSATSWIVGRRMKLAGSAMKPGTETTPDVGAGGTKKEGDK
jgi:formate dehydrogenase iron-sulfur subunit